MPRQTIDRIRQLIRDLNYVVSTHAADELEDDNLTILDLENAILTGQIVERQTDRQTRERKFVIHGVAINDAIVETVVRFGKIGTLIVITVYRV